MGRASEGLWKVVVAPGGTHAYGLSYRAAAIMVFDRNPATGALAQRAGVEGCLAENVAGCKAARTLAGANGMVISPDGANVYVASGAGGSANGAGAIAVFDRNPATGELTQKAALAGCLTTDGYLGSTSGQCTAARGIASVSTLALSPDGRFLYTAASYSVGVFQRNPDTGTLTQAPDATGCATSNGAPATCAGVRGLYAARQIALTPDGRSLYVPAQTPVNSLVIFDRDPGSGAIAQKPGTAGCFGAAAGCAPEPRLASAIAATASPDSRHVYVSVVDGILTYARAGDGGLALQSCITDSGTNGCSAGRNLRVVSYSAMSPDGQALVAGLEPQDSPGIVTFERDGAGNLVQPAGGDGCVTPSGSAWIKGTLVPNQCAVHPALGGDGQMTFVDDGSFIAGAYFSDSAVAFKRDLYPQCANQSFNVTQNVAAPLPFACSDRNGDPMSFTISSNPIAGALGAIDQAAARVFYNPFSGFLGADSVSYRATAAGLSSNDARLDINVVPPFVPTPRPRTVTSPVSYNWRVKRSRLTLRQLVVRRLPVGATVTLTCKGKRCPFKSRTIKRSRKSTMNVLNAKTLRRKKTFRAGQTLDVRIAAPGMNTKVLRFKLRRGKVPKHRTYCVPLGAKRAQRSCS